MKSLWRKNANMSASTCEDMKLKQIDYKLIKFKNGKINVQHGSIQTKENYMQLLNINMGKIPYLKVNICEANLANKYNMHNKQLNEKIGNLTSRI